MSVPSYSIGIEEEYLLVDPVTRNLAVDPPQSVFEECSRKLEGRVSPEFMRCQIEVGTPVCTNIGEARVELANLRRTVSDIARAHDLEIIASSTHPFGSWRPQKTTERDRYEQLRQDIGVPVRRLLICATHVHVGIEDDNLRIDLMNQMRYFLPHLLALSTSSPFWEGTDTGLKSYRLAVFNELPRTGIPEPYSGYSDYEQHLHILTETGVIEDGTKIWWDIRPSARFPTLEMRICDIPTRMDDSITITSIYLSVLRMLWRLKRTNATWRRYNTLLINENRWRAMRYGIDAGLIDFGRHELVPYASLLDEVIELVREDAEALGCLDEVLHARTILERKTSAHNQIQQYEDALAEGRPPAKALESVVDWLIAETRHGL
ncbi:MAG: carboxylate-amine ligase [Pseudomonadota bacterium]